MKKITYKERATFYIQEVNKDYKKIKLLKTIKKKYNINSMVLCPCASGIYLRECSELFEESYFIDIEKTMINIINDQIAQQNIKNVKTYICDMKNINELKIECDCIFALDQGIQYLNSSDLKKFLENSYSVTKYIVLEVFDFNLGKSLTYYDSKIEDNKFYFSKQFTFNELNIKRYNKHIHHKSYIEFWYQYFNKDNHLFETNFKLYNYEPNTIKKIVDRSNRFVIQEKIKDKNGTYIIVLKRISDKNRKESIKIV